jgi:hypothetical protein
LINGVVLLDKTFWYETGTALAELSYQRLDKVTKNPNMYYSTDNACKTGYLLGGFAAGVRNQGDGCSTKDSLAFAMQFNPTWMGALPSVDLTMPISYHVGVFGNSPTLGGSNQGAYGWSIGLTAVYRTLYEFGMMVSDQHQDYKTAAANATNGVPGQAIFATGNGQTAEQNSHRWLSVHFKTSF